MKGQLAYAAALACFLVTHDAHTTTILLVTDKSAQAIMKRIYAELKAAGFHVISIPPPQGPVLHIAMLEEARRHSAIAALRVKPSGTGAELWVVDRVTGKTVLREVPNGADDALLATKTTELLRASLLEVNVPSFEPSEVPVPKQVEDFVPRTERISNAYVSAGASALHLGSVGTLGLVTGGFHLTLGEHLLTGARLGLPVSRTTLSDVEGSSTQSMTFAQMEFDYLPFGVQSVWSPVFALSLGGSVFHSAGSANEPYQSESAHVISMVGSVRGGARLQLGSRLAVQGDGAATAFLPQPSVTYANRTVSKVPLPALEASIRLSLSTW